MIRFSVRFAFFIIFLAGCATTSNIKNEDRVTILLKDGTKIKAQVSDISSSTIAFEAIDRKKAYDYGEVIQLDLVRGIRMPSGEIFSVNPECQSPHKDVISPCAQLNWPALLHYPPIHDGKVT